MNDFARIARVIEYLGANFREQPSLDRLAEEAGLSSYHFHRLFRRWAQTTPKSFVQHLTALEAGRLLRNGTPVLDTALEVGLSGPGRLHDLCVNLEAASPGEIGSGGEGWNISAGFCDSPFGDTFIANGPRGLCRLSFVASREGREQEWTTLQQLWPEAKCLRDDQAAEEVSRSVFNDRKERDESEPLRLFVSGTAFQTRVWRALVAIPPGEVCSYSRIAETIGSPSASRAVGTAVGQNPLAVVIPCHRVIQATGELGNYRWGANRKKAVLAWERSFGSSETD